MKFEFVFEFVNFHSLLNKTKVDPWSAREKTIPRGIIIPLAYIKYLKSATLSVVNMKNNNDC